MKKKTKTLLALLLTAAVAVSALAFMPACGGAPDSDDAPSHIVYSNGGTSVLYNGYLYYVNGIPDYTDENGTTNKQGAVTKGGLYRTKVTETREKLGEAEKRFAAEDGKTDLNIKDNAQLRDVLDFDKDYIEKLDWEELGDYRIGDPDNNEDPRIIDENGNTVQNKIAINGEQSEYRVKSDLVISKKIGTSGYDGGFWIYDGIVYFATPDTDRNTSGEVMADRAEFYSYNLATRSLTQLYTATEVSAEVPYTFMKRGADVYLLTFETYFANADDEQNGIKTGFIVSTRIADGRTQETKNIVSGVSSVHFPNRSTYDPDYGYDENNGYDLNAFNTPLDYVYYTREIKSSEGRQGSYLLGAIDPAGVLNEKNGTVGEYNTAMPTIIGATDKYLYYTYTSNGNKALECSDLYYQRKAMFVNNGSDAADFAAPVEYNHSISQNTSSYVTILPVESEFPCVAVSKSDGFYRYEANENGVVETKVLEGSSPVLLGHMNGRLYGTMASTETDDETGEENTTAGMFFSCSAFESVRNEQGEIQNRTVVPLLLGLPTTEPFGIDFVSFTYDAYMNDSATSTVSTTESFVTYYGDYTETATDYMYLKKVSGMFDSDSAYSVRLGVVPEYERTKIVCSDTDCIDWHHDHSSWENFGSEEEECGIQGPSDSSFVS